MNKNLKILIASVFTVFLVFFAPFWAAVSLAIIFSFLLFPLLCRLDKHHRIKGKRAVAAVIITTLLLLFPFALGFYAATSRVMTLAKEAKGNQSVDVLEAENIKKGVIQRVREYSKKNDINISKETIESINKVSDNIESTILDVSKRILIGIPEFSVHLLVFTLSFYVFLLYGVKIKQLIIKLDILNKDDLDELIMVCQESCYHTVISLIIVGTIQAAIVLLGAWVAKFEELLLIFSLTFIFSFIPVIGAGPVALILSIIRFVEQDWKMGLVLLVTSLIAGTIDNVLKPLLLKRRTTMDGAVSLITILGAIIVLGIPGLFIGPVIGHISAYYYEKLK